MAHGGHTGGARSHSHVHHYGGGYGRGGGYDSLGVIMLELIFSIGLCIAAAFLVFNITGADEIGGKKTKLCSICMMIVILFLTKKN